MANTCVSNYILYEQWMHVFIYGPFLAYLFYKRRPQHSPSAPQQNTSHRLCVNKYSIVVIAFRLSVKTPHADDEKGSMSRMAMYGPSLPQQQTPALMKV